MKQITLDEKQSKIIRSTAQNIYSSMKINKTIPLEDLIQFGYVGWLEAREKFDPSRKVNFNTFAWYRIRGAIVDGLRDMGFFSRSGFRKFKNNYKIISLSTIDLKFKRKKGCMEVESVDFIPSDNGTFVNKLEDNKKHSELMKAIHNLPLREQKMLNDIYFKEQDLKTIGKSLKLSKSWLCRLHERTLKQLAEEIGA